MQKAGRPLTDPHSIITMAAMAYNHDRFSCRAWPPLVACPNLARNHAPGRPAHLTDSAAKQSTVHCLLLQKLQLKWSLQLWN